MIKSEFEPNFYLVRTLDINICPTSPRRARPRARNDFLKFNSQLPKLVSEVRSGSNSGDNSDEQLLLVRASFVES
jgi:hypothetical protein